MIYLITGYISLFVIYGLSKESQEILDEYYRKNDSQSKLMDEDVHLDQGPVRRTSSRRRNSFTSLSL